MTLTPLHLALGLTDGDLSFELVQQACERAVGERDDLDWKSTLPLTLPPGKETGRDAQQDELAKDIAAIANSRGGMIVYGVAEDRGTSTADHVNSVGQPEETILQKIRRVASNLIYPPVTGITLQWLTGGVDDVVLALQVGQSLEAPHLVRPKNQPSGSGYWFAVPFRNGPDTDWMPEKMIESAYRDRLVNRRQRDEDLRELHADLVATLANTAGGAWVVAVARPDTPLPARPRLLDMETAGSVFERAWRSAGHGHIQTAVAADYVLSDVPVRRGLRRFSQIGTAVTDAAVGGQQPRVRAIAEVHADGSVGVALTRGGSFHRDDITDDRALATTDLDQVALNLFMLAQSAAQTLRVSGDYEAMLSVEPAIGSFFRRPDPRLLGHFQPFTADDRIGAFRPVLGPLLLSQGGPTALDSLVDLAEDAVNQTRTGSRLESLRPSTDPGQA